MSGYLNGKLNLTLLGGYRGVGIGGVTTLRDALYTDGVNDIPLRLDTDPGGLYVPPATGPFTMAGITWARSANTRYAMRWAEQTTGALVGVNFQLGARYMQLLIRNNSGTTVVNTFVDFGMSRLEEWIWWAAVRDAADLWKIYARPLGDASWLSSSDGGDTYTGMPSDIDSLEIGAGANFNGNTAALIGVERDLWASGEMDAWYASSQQLPLLGDDDGVRYPMERGGYPQALDTGPNENHLTLSGYPGVGAAFPEGYPQNDAGVPS